MANLNLNIKLPFFNRVSNNDKAFLARQLATMLESGLAIDKALSILIDQVRNPYFKNVLNKVLEEVKGGLSLSDAMKKHTDVFDQVYISIIVSGEAVGKLSDVLKQLADNLEKQDKFINDVKSAFYYPGFILIIMLVIVYIMMTQVIPPLKEIFGQFQAQLPWTTKILIGLSDFALGYWWLILLILISIVVFIYFYLKTDNGKYFLAKIQIQLPYQIGKDIYMNRFTQILSMLLHSGTPIIKALNISADVMNNVIYRDAIIAAANQMERGIPLSIPLSKDSIFDPLVSQMIKVGEETGKLDQVLDKMAIHFEDEGARKLKNINSLMEPALIVIIGLGVAFIIFSVILPIYQMVQMQA